MQKARRCGGVNSWAGVAGTKKAEQARPFGDGFGINFWSYVPSYCLTHQTYLLMLIAGRELHHY